MTANNQNSYTSELPVYLSFDGGGSYGRAILFNDEGLLGYGESGGTNTNFSSLEDCRRNIAQCLDQALKNPAHRVIDMLYAVVIGPGSVLEEEIMKRAILKDSRFISEGYACLISGIGRSPGIVALSGTGSVSYYINNENNITNIGGAGSILGDYGSGFWIGQQALRKTIEYGEGRGESTIFLEMILQEWNIRSFKGIISTVHGMEAPFRKVASVVPLAAEAASKGDHVCQTIFKEAGRHMAEQTLTLIKKTKPEIHDKICVCCGGTWKANPIMYESFVQIMTKDSPNVQVKKPSFDPVMAGVIIRVLEHNKNLNFSTDPMFESYNDFRSNW